MGSLFTRAFVFFWATIVVFTLSAAALTTVNLVAVAAEPQRLARQAQAILDAGGLAALKAWLSAHNQQDTRSGQRLLVLDPSGRDILGQRWSFRRLRASGGAPRLDRPPAPPGPPPDLPVFPRITAADGTRFVLVIDPPPARGLLSPPFSGPGLAALLALALAVSGGVAYAFARSISRPLERLQTTARQLAEGRLDARAAPADVARGDEVGALAREVDAMARRLAALIEARRNLLRDVSHELRSPLTRLQIAVGLARQASTDPARQLDQIEREGARLAVLIGRILEYARLERDPSTLSLEPVDVAELLRRVVHDAAFEAQAAPGRLRLSIGPGLEGGSARLPAADPAVLHTALDNVVRNAIVHGGDGVVELSLDTMEGELTIEVRDHGPGVPPQDLERIFEPFYRVAADGPAIEGYGIGLPLALRAVELHRGRVTADNAEGGGLRVRMQLPRTRVAGRQSD